MVVLGPRCMRGGKNRPTIWVKISKKLTWVRKKIYIYIPLLLPPPLKNIIPLYLGGWKCSKNRSVKNVIRRDSTNTVSVISVSQNSHTRVGIRLLLILIIRKWWHYSSRAVEEEVKESLGVSLLLRVAARQASIKQTIVEVEGLDVSAAVMWVKVSRIIIFDHYQGCTFYDLLWLLIIIGQRVKRYIWMVVSVRFKSVRTLVITWNTATDSFTPSTLHLVPTINILLLQHQQNPTGLHRTLKRERVGNKTWYAKSWDFFPSSTPY